MPSILAIHVGMPRPHGCKNASEPAGREWISGYVKAAVHGNIAVSFTNLAGDGQADRKHHGGVDKAVLAYSSAHYSTWCEELQRNDLCPGAFGENLTVLGQTEATVCIGDTYRIGEVVLQVTQPRQPCWKISRVWDVVDFAQRVQQTGRTGWYLRVLREGQLSSGLPMALVDRPLSRWTIEAANRLMHERKDDVAGAAELAGSALLSANWRATFKRRVEHGTHPDPTPRLTGSPETAGGIR